jgi:subtilisin family serine protease
MSSIFSTDELGNALSGDSALFSDSFEVASSTAYGLDLNGNTGLSASLATASLSNEISTNLESTDWSQSAPLMTDFIKGDHAVDDSYRPTSGSADELTGLEEGGSLLYATTAVEPISGELSENDQANPTRSGAFKDDYLLSPQQTETVQINLDSSAFDAYLQLVDATTGELLDSNDDSTVNGSSVSNSQISFTAEAGRQYLIRATSYFASATGSYSLTTHIGSGNEPSPPNNSLSGFDSLYGYGLVDAASAVAAAVGQSRFGNVADIGGNQWNNDMVNAPEAWAQGYTGQGVTVAVIDSGVDFTHSDLNNSMWINTDDVFGDNIDNDNNGYVDDTFGWNFGIGEKNNNILPGTSNPGQEHGTHVAGTIASASNNIGTTGVAYNAKIMALRLGDVDENRFTNGGNLSQAIRYAVDNGADVINISLAWSDPDGHTAEALAYAASRNVIAVMAAGNSENGNQFSPQTPASYATDYGISVGAVASNGRIADFSHQAGTDSRMRHVMAPGVDIYSTVLNNSWALMPGTSMAAPHVAGVVALMLSANPNLTHAQVREILTGTATSATASTNSVLASSAGSSEKGILAADSDNWASHNWDGFVADVSTAGPVLKASDSVDALYEAKSSVEASFQLANIETAAMSESLLKDSRMLDSVYSDDWQFQLPQPSFDELLVPMMA